MKKSLFILLFSAFSFVANAQIRPDTTYSFRGVVAKNDTPRVGLSWLGNFCDTCAFGASQAAFQMRKDKSMPYTPTMIKQVWEKQGNKDKADNAAINTALALKASQASLNTEVIARSNADNAQDAAIAAKANTSDVASTYETKVASVDKYNYVDSMKWGKLGNYLTGTEFFGSTNEQPLIFKTNNIEGLRLDEKGRVKIGGTIAGTYWNSSMYINDQPTHALVNGGSRNQALGILSYIQPAANNANTYRGVETNMYTATPYNIGNIMGIKTGYNYYSPATLAVGNGIVNDIKNFSGTVTSTTALANYVTQGATNISENIVVNYNSYDGQNTTKTKSVSLFKTELRTASGGVENLSIYRASHEFTDAIKADTFSVFKIDSSLNRDKIVGQQAFAFVNESNLPSLTKGSWEIKAESENPLIVTSTKGGVVFPRLTTAQRDAISAPLAGTQIYNVEAQKMQVRTSTQWIEQKQDAITAASFSVFANDDIDDYAGLIAYYNYCQTNCLSFLLEKGNYTSSQKLAFATPSCDIVFKSEGAKITYTGTTLIDNFVYLATQNGKNLTVEGITFDAALKANVAFATRNFSPNTYITIHKSGFINAFLSAISPTVSACGLRIEGAYEEVNVTYSKINNISRELGTGVTSSYGTSGVSVSPYAAFYAKKGFFLHNEISEISNNETIGSAKDYDVDGISFFSPINGEFSSCVIKFSSFRNIKCRPYKTQCFSTTGTDNTFYQASAKGGDGVLIGYAQFGNHNCTNNKVHLTENALDNSNIYISGSSNSGGQAANTPIFANFAENEVYNNCATSAIAVGFSVYDNIAGNRKTTIEKNSINLDITNFFFATAAANTINLSSSIRDNNTKSINTLTYGQSTNSEKVVVMYSGNLGAITTVKNANQNVTAQ